MADEEPSGFLGRWSRRKVDALQGKPLTEPVPVAPAPAAAPQTAPLGDAAPLPATVADAAEPETALSLDDVKLLTKDSDFKPFMTSKVGPEVRNAAMKKLFADPHFNIMDGLDTYIDDYSKPDPLPASMLRQLTSAKFLKLFDDEEDAEGKKAPSTGLPRENANDPEIQTVAQSYEGADIGPPDLPNPENPSQPQPPHSSGASQENHADTDLRLQPDDAPPAPNPGGGA